MTHEARSVVRVVEPHVDRETHVVDRQQHYEGGSDDHRDGLLDDLLYSKVGVLPEVEEHGGEVGGDEGVDAAAGPRQVGVGVGEAGAQTARQHSGDIDHEDLVSDVERRYVMY